MSGPIFGRPPARRPSMIQGNVPFTANEDQPHTPSRKSTLRTSTATDAHLRIVSLQIGEREAVNLIRSLCDEGESLFRVRAKTEDIVDCLSGVLVLGNFMKRIGNEKNNLEKELNQKIREFNDMEGQKNELIEQMEHTIMKLQAENMQMSDALQEISVKHSYKITIMTKEMNATRDALAEVQAENQRCRAKLEAQEKKLMSIPRLEEQYMRHARSAVRQSEVANTMNRIEFRKMEEELKSLSFWKNKAKSLEETITRLQSDVETLDLQNRTTLSKYQQLVRSVSAARATNGTMTANSNSQTVGSKKVLSSSTSGKSSRPSTAPSARRTSSMSASTPALAQSSLTNANQNGNKDNRQSNNLSNTDASAEADLQALLQAETNAMHEKAAEASAAEEILRLRNEAIQKDAMIVKLARRLSYARAHPLLAIDETTDIALDNKQDTKNQLNAATMAAEDHDYANQQQQLAQQRDAEHRTLLSRNPLIGMRLQDLPYMDEDLGSLADNSVFLAEEAALQDERNHRAMLLQQTHLARHNHRRQQAPAHIMAIREARSFGRSIDDLVAERDGAYRAKNISA